MKRLTFILFFFGLNIITVTATVPTIEEIKQQPIKVILEQAEKLYDVGAYSDAYSYYKALSEMKYKARHQDLYRLGKTALAVKEYQIAQEFLEPLLPKARLYPLINYEFALSLKFSGQYIEAAKQFQSFLNTYQSDPNNDYVKMAQSQLQSCQKALKEKANTSQWFIGDFADSTNQDATIYRALTFPSKFKIALVECQTEKGTCIKKVYFSEDGFDQVEDLKGSVGNPIFNSCSPYIASDGETVFFAQQEMGKAEYKIFTGQMDIDGEVINIQKLGPGINREGFSSTHPTIGVTEHGQQILYFAATLPGSIGGYDIWYSVQTTDGNFTMSYNLGTRVNGEGDDITPFYYQEHGELYFSSEKLQGYGGLDVYRMTGEKKRWKENTPFHLESPVNSTGNDFHYKKNANEEGSFSTDRDGKKEKTVKFKKNINA